MAKKGSYEMMLHGKSVQLESLGAEQLAKLKEECMAKLHGLVEQGRKFSVMYMDPPWTYQKARGLEGMVPYPTMTLAQLKLLPVRQLAHIDCALFMWTTSAQLPDALELYKAWGFQYKTIFRVWRKTNLNTGTIINGLGHWSRGCYEYLLVGARGSGFLKHRKANESQEITWPSPGHSCKPPHARTGIERLRIPGPHLELFARGTDDDSCPVWTRWGLEVDGFVSEVVTVTT